MHEYETPDGEILTATQAARALLALATALDRTGHKDAAHLIRLDWRAVAARPVLWWMLQTMLIETARTVALRN